MTLLQAAARLGLAPSTLRHQIANGSLRATKRGRDWWLTEAAVREYETRHLGKPGRRAKVETCVATLRRARRSELTHTVVSVTCGRPAAFVVTSLRAPAARPMCAHHADREREDWGETSRVALYQPSA